MVYLIYNKTHEQWVMPDFVGYTEYYESAGVFSDNVIRNKTGIFFNKTGDSLDNVLVNFYTLKIERLIGGLKESENKRFTNLVNVMKRARGLPLSIVEKNGNKVCPYCYKPIQFLNAFNTTYMLCNNCYKSVERDLT